MAKEQIKWSPKLVSVADIKPTPKNYKLKTELGMARLQASLKSFGLAGTVIVNTDNTLIDGNSRLDEAKRNKELKMWVSMPNRKLSPKEFTEMSAMYDFAKAGEVDIQSIQNDLGTSQDFYDKYKLAVPLSLLGKMGKSAEVPDGLEYDSKVKGKGDNTADVESTGNIKMVNLFFETEQEKRFRAMEELLADKFRGESTTDSVRKALNYAAKQLGLKCKPI